jgi:hypothetical protein
MLTHDEANVLMDATRAPLMPVRSTRAAAAYAWVSTRSALIEHDRYDVAHCCCAGWLTATPAGSVVITAKGAAELADYHARTTLPVAA